MLFIVGVVALLAIRATAQSCTCHCTVDGCLQELVGTLPFASQATVSDCRSFLWTRSTVAATTITETIAPTTVTATSGTAPTGSITATDIPAYAAACSDAAAYSSACECVGITAGGTTYIHVESSTTTIVVPAATPDVSCGSAGLEVAIYNNPFTTFTTPNYPEFIPEYFKSVAPYDSDKTNALGIRSTAEMNNPHGFTPATVARYVLNYRGFFYSPNTTTYTFRLSDADDYAGFWTGPKAYTGWTRANRDGESIYRAAGNPPVVSSIQVDLTAGEYIPIRIIFGNRGGVGKYTFEVFDSAGFSYVEYGVASPYLVSYSCIDPNEAPPHADPFGAES